MLVLVALAIYRAMVFYYTEGINWDFVSSYLNAIAILKPGFSSNLYLYSSNTIATDDVDNNVIYFELQRAPLPYFILAGFIKVFGTLATPLFIVACIILLFATALLISKELGTEKLLLISLLLVPYTISTLIFDDPQDILSMALIIISLVFLLRNSRYFGLFLGLAGMAKYTSLIFFPLIFFLNGEKKMEALSLMMIVTVPWLIFNAYYFGNPYYSYILQVQGNGIVSTTGVGSVSGTLIPILQVLAYPILAVLLVVAALAALRKRDVAKKLHGLKKERNFRILLLFLILAVIGLVIVGKNQGGFTVQRYAEFVYLALALLAVLVIDSLIKVNVKNKSMSTYLGLLPFAFAIFSIILMTLFYSTLAATANAALSYSTRNPFYSQLISDISAAGISNCKIVSNIWPLLIYYNISAYPPYLGNQTPATYPFVISAPVGVRDYSIPKNNYTIVNFTNVTIYLPKNYKESCG